MRYYGEETKKAMANFGGGQLPAELIASYAEVKKAALLAVQENENHFEESDFEMIIASLDEIIDGIHNDQFVIPLRQGGAGTSIHMNLNEVVANLAKSKIKEKMKKTAEIDSIDDINRYQSTNDTFPTAVTIIVFRKLLELEKDVVEFQENLIRKESEYRNILLAGRTEMQSALPITLGQVFAGWAGSIERDRWRLHKLKERIRTVPLGGTALGSCFFAPQKYIFLAEKHLRNVTGLPLSRSQNLPDEISNQDKFSELACGIKLCAENLSKMTGDLLLYTSSMVGEIRHPRLQEGSTIMAAKVNPVILEYARGLSIDTIFECDKISEYSRSGQLQLNAYLPFILEAFLKAYTSISLAIRAILDKFLNGMEIDPGRIEQNLLTSKVLLNVLVPLLGYHKVKELDAKFESDKPRNLEQLIDMIAENTDLKKQKLKDYFDPIRLTSSCKD